MLNVTNENFTKEVLEAKVRVLVDFWAPWCGPCRAIAPILEELAKVCQDNAKIVKVNVDEEEDLVIKYNIKSIPTLIVFSQGKIETSVMGIRSLEELKEMLKI